MSKKKPSQMLIIIMCWLIYSLSYLGRYSYNANITLIIDDYGVTKAQAGLAATFFFFAYGVGQVVNGILSGRYNKKWIFPIVLFISSLLNLAVFFGAPFITIKYLWLINGFVQSCLWACVISVISRTVDGKHMRIAMMFMSTTTCFGTIVSYTFGSLFSYLNNYRLSFVFGALVMTLLGISWFAVYTPEMEVEKIGEASQDKAPEAKQKMHGLIALFVLLGFFGLFNNLVKDGLTTWAPDILKDRYGMTDSFSILLTVVLPLLGVFGALFSVWLNKYIKDLISLSLVMLVVGAIATGSVAAVTNMNVFVVVICFGVVECMMHGVINIVNTMAPLEKRDYVDSGKVAGVMNGFAYAGSTLSSYGLGKIADIGGWQLVLNLLFELSVLVILTGFAYAFVTRKKYQKNQAL